MKATTFEFVNYDWNNDSKEVQLHYCIIFDNGEKLPLCERFIFPTSVSQNEDGFMSALQTLHLLCGITYWKLYCPSSIILSNVSLSKDQANFWNTVYTKGLGEFFYKNSIDFRGLVSFPYDEKAVPELFQVNTEEKAFISIGGGKDSIVLYELLKKCSVPTTTYLLETQKKYQIVNDVLQVMGIDAMRVQRHIDPKLFEHNSLPETYNGHIPITAIYSMIGVLLSIMNGYKYVVMANEKSANVGNVEYLGQEINHQWSKSLEFEMLLSDYIHKYISNDISYFSLLRPWSEMKITQEFVNYPKYFSVFSSCNNNFKIHKDADMPTRWCGTCPKCAFVFAMLSAYVPKKIVFDIFQKNLYADESLITLYEQLLGLRDFKPFECVGTPDEVKLAFYKAYSNGEYENDSVMRMFINNVLPTMKNADKLEKSVMRIDSLQTMPDVFKACLL